MVFFFFHFRPSDVTFSGSSGLPTPLRRASVPFSPKRQQQSQQHQSSGSRSQSFGAGVDNVVEDESEPQNPDEMPVQRRASFVSKATVFIDGAAASNARRDVHSPSRVRTTSKSPKSMSPPPPVPAQAGLVSPPALSPVEPASIVKKSVEDKTSSEGNENAHADIR